LDAQDELSQLFAAVAAARLGPRNPIALERAAESEHPAVSSFAAEELESLL
jgi:hypothetical protein